MPESFIIVFDAIGLRPACACSCAKLSLPLAGMIVYHARYPPSCLLSRQAASTIGRAVKYAALLVLVACQATDVDIGTPHSPQSDSRALASELSVYPPGYRLRRVEQLVALRYDDIKVADGLREQITQWSSYDEVVK